MAICNRLFWLLVSFVFAAAAVLLYFAVTKGLFVWIPPLDSVLKIRPIYFP
jgi:hypothetical protein